MARFASESEVRRVASFILKAYLICHEGRKFLFLLRGKSTWHT